jgi:hypothetical protein
VIHQSLENNKNQKLADSLYIKLRQIQLRKNLYDPSINFFDKIREIFVFVIVGYFFGWGVKVRNTVYTILLTIVCYAFIYNREMTFVMNGSKIENFKEALLFSFSRTFSIGEDLYTPGVMTFLDYSHGFLSLVLITIFTGVFMRKIIT